ncbi:hypothetical protein Taro_024324 [Colocasia esculenta]|uniref:Retrotransposon gag domain-containing protein n=1 Tax=Colocasia esculenta TaxID=4460 RepID=A0A843VE51_COLES|nr:hypothetical protein [Colocasia esculenta]
MKGECPENKKDKYKKVNKLKKAKAMVATWSDDDPSEDEEEKSSSTESEEICFMANSTDGKPIRGRRTRIKYVIGLTGLAEVFCHSWYQSKKFEMADRRDWGGGGDDPEESTQRMIERIWESLIDIRARMDQQAPVPPVAVPTWDGETIPIAPVMPGVEVPFVAPVPPPPPPVLLAEEPVMQVEKFLRLQPPTYSGGPNPNTAEHWVHEIEIVFATMRCPAVDKVVLAGYQLRGFALEWWRLKMQTTFAVEVPSGEFLLTSSYVDEVPVMIEGNQMPGRLYALQLTDYDIILGICHVDDHFASDRMEVAMQCLDEEASDNCLE